jgi:hypothetical protein
MLADILIALVFALIIEMFGALGKTMKHILIVVCCATLIIVYFCSGKAINFVGTMDFSIWVLFVVIFYTILGLLEQLYMRKQK